MKKLILFLIFLLFIPFMVLGQVSTQTDTFYVTDDSFVRDGTYASNNYGSETIVYTKNHVTSYNRLGLLQFNVGSTFSEATTATLYVYLTRDVSTNCSWYESDGASWDESTVTWNNKPVTSDKIIDFSITSVNVWRSFDVTDYVNNLIVADDSIVTFILWDGVSAYEQTIEIYSKEYSSGTYKAYLVIQEEDWGPDRPDIMFCVEERDYYNGGCSGVSPGYSGFTHYLKYPSLEYQEFSDSVFCHYNNAGYNDSGQSYVIGNVQYQANCACKPNPGPYINMYIRNFATKTTTDSLTVLDDGESLRLTLQGINRYPLTDSLLLSGFLRVGHPTTITGDDRSFGIYSWKPGESTCYLKFAVPSAPTGIAVDDDSLCYLTFEYTDTLYVINWRTWEISQKVKLASTGTDNRGCTLVEGDTLIAVMDKDNDYMRFYSKNSFSLVRSVDFVPYMIPHNEYNFLYGSWFVKRQPPTPIIIRY